MAMPHIMETYGRLPIAFTRGEGVWLWDRDGKRYLDAIAGVAVNAIGHCHPKLVAALREQVGTLIHTSNLYEVELQEKLAAKLCELSGMDKVFFCNSGAEANSADASRGSGAEGAQPVVKNADKSSTSDAGSGKTEKASEKPENPETTKAAAALEAATAVVDATR